MILRVIGHQLLTKLIRRNHICGEITQLGILCLNLRVLNLSGSGWEEGNVIGTPQLIELDLSISCTSTARTYVMSEGAFT